MAERKHYGIHKAVVSNIKDPEKRGRIKVQCPDILGESVESAWCDPMVTVAYEKGGDFCVPKTNDGVWVMFQDGDPNKPICLGGWWSKENSPLEKKYENLEDTRIIKYADVILTMHTGVMEIEIGGNKIVKMEPEKITIKADLDITGDIKIKGDVMLDGTLRATGDVIAQSISLINHTHIDSLGGKTTKPQ